jgi:hypothetical protein
MQNSDVASQPLLRAERADARSVEQRVGRQASMPRASVGRCATPGLRARPPSDPEPEVTFLNGRTGDISIWWTQQVYETTFLGCTFLPQLIGLD